MPRALYILLLVFGLAPAQLFAAPKPAGKGARQELALRAFAAAHTELDKAPVQVLPAAHYGHSVSAGTACPPPLAAWPLAFSVTSSRYSSAAVRRFAPVHLRHNYFSHGFF